MSDAYFIRTRHDGHREISWRAWTLIWVVPVLFLGAAALTALQALTAPWGKVEAVGEVVELREYEGWSPLEGEVTNYAPSFRYTRGDGREVTASAGMSHSEWNFPVGSRKTILYDPDTNGDVYLPGPWHWILPGALAALGLATALPALILSLVLLRWRARAPVHPGARN
ncbi:DUF3592 domain-containing protein [Oceanicola sp. 502str15]|uniref:DUF3592 domain-containing protein n=1 Tax=Oceanicola sp. 502str15 TaxID=2696061 RepID=UPI0020949031|nr:DUF3592 domain-containing protein [Oceanicola sp. 502str15]MCO6382319.1 hypothetical protein [Oceanicola sp. 502str15]